MMCLQAWNAPMTFGEQAKVLHVLCCLLQPVHLC
jgi:hypothetical protein